VRRHTVRAEQTALQPWWPRWISIDWGFEHPSAVYWHAANPDGRVVTYREFVANHLSPRMLGQAIAERSIEPNQRGERIGEIYLSPDAFARRSSELTIADQVGDILAQNDLPRPVPADDDRIGGWMLMYQMLETGQWVIADNCARLIECLRSLTRDPANVEDALKTSGDDPADSARYGLKSRIAPGRVPVEQLIAERVSAADPTSRAIWTQKFLADERALRHPSPILRRR
jgi:hypothetical protein